MTEYMKKSDVLEIVEAYMNPEDTISAICNLKGLFMGEDGIAFENPYDDFVEDDEDCGSFWEWVKERFKRRS